MGKRESSEEVGPLYLPLGMRIGLWRVTGFRGRGGYGTLYRAEHVGREAAGPFALKLAIYPKDLPSEAQVSRLLAQVARALEQVAHRASSVATHPLFEWGITRARACVLRRLCS